MKKTWMYVLLAAGMTTALYSCDSEAKRADESQTTTSSVNVQAASQSPEPSADLPVISFAEKEFDFGTIQEGDSVVHVYKFTNTGKAPLVIQSATAQCGCTVPQKPDKPIAPGETGEIKVVFNSRGKVGVQSKAISVTANTQPEVTQVILKGVVESGVASMQGPVRPN